MFLNSFLSNSQIFAACDFNHSAFEQLIQAISSRHHYDYDRHYRSHSDSCHSEPPPVVDPHDDCPKDDTPVPIPNIVAETASTSTAEAHEYHSEHHHNDCQPEPPPVVEHHDDCPKDDTPVPIPNASPETNCSTHEHDGEHHGHHGHHEHHHGHHHGGGCHSAPPPVVEHHDCPKDDTPVPIPNFAAESSAADISTLLASMSNIQGNIDRLLQNMHSGAECGGNDMRFDPYEPIDTPKEECMSWESMHCWMDMCHLPAVQPAPIPV